MQLRPKVSCTSQRKPCTRSTHPPLLALQLIDGDRAELLPNLLSGLHLVCMDSEAAANRSVMAMNRGQYKRGGSQLLAGLSMHVLRRQRKAGQRRRAGGRG